MSPQKLAELNDCMNRLADGDRTAFDAVYDLTWPIVHRYSLKIFSASHDADDIAQQVLMKVFSRAQEFKIGSPALAWILGITVFECKTLRQNVRRRRENLVDSQSLEEHIFQGANAEEDLAKKVLQDILHALLKELNPQDRETILVSLDEMDKPEIPAATYRKRLERTLERLRESWSRHE